MTASSPQNDAAPETRESMSKRFARRALWIHGPTGGITVDAWHSLAYPGLALHRTTIENRPSIELGWTISHVTSGTACVKYAMTLAEAVRALDEIGPLCDWTLSGAEIDRLPSRDMIARTLNRILEHLDAGYRLQIGPVSRNALASESAPAPHGTPTPRGQE